MSGLLSNRRRESFAHDLVNSRAAVLLWATYAFLAVLLGGYLVTLLVRSTAQTSTWLDGWFICGIELIASGLCIGRGFLRRPGRAAAFILGLALLSWTIGDILLTIESLGGATPPTPSAADIFYLAFYPLTYVAVMLFIKSEHRHVSVSSWLDGGIAALGAAALCAAFAFQRVVSSTGGSGVATLANLAYPIGDVLLLGMVVGGFALLSGKNRAPWALLAAGLMLNVLGDTSNLFPNSLGSSRFGIILNAIAWPSSIVLMSMAVWLRQHAINPLRIQEPPGFIIPGIAGFAALAVLFTASLVTVGRMATGLAAAALAAAGVRLILTMTEIQRLSQERSHQSVTDDLTGLRNRRYLFRVLDTFFEDCAITGEPRSLAFLFVDLNRFKEVNDTFGHPAGDELLRQLGERMSGALRESDLLVRIGGDEFAVVLIDGDASYGVEVAERLTDCLNEPFALEVVTAQIGASIGIAVAPDDASDSAGLVWCADVAMYRSKLGSTSFASYNQNLDENGDQMHLVEDLREAISSGHLVLHYQPQLNLVTGEILNVEALVRWDHPRLGLLPPDKFIPLAEDSGLMGALTTWVLGEAAAQCAAWRDGARPLTVAVNISPSSLLDPGFVTEVLATLDIHGLGTDALVLEITETCVIEDFERARRVIDELQDHGFCVSIDDFGAGVTSLAYLSNLAVQELKLDRVFIAGTGGEGGDRQTDLIRSTIDLGHAMGLRIVAEGIEDGETLRLLAGLGCDFAQGYCISRPMPAGDLAFQPIQETTSR